jgi:hypothetical protein
LIKASDNTSNIQRNQSLTLNYNIANISKSINISFLAGGSIDYNFTQTNLFNFNSNINVYRRMVFDERNTIVLKHRFSKGYYFSKNDHKIQVEYTVSSSFSDSQIIQENELYPLSSEQYDGGLSLAFIPQNIFFNEIKLKSNLSTNFIRINNTKVNAIQYNKSAISFNKTNGKHNYNLRFYSEVFNSQSETLLRNDFELNYRFYLSKNTSLFLKGISILNILGINENAGNLMTNSSSGLNITTINTNTFGYLITGIEFKL